MIIIEPHACFVQRQLDQEYEKELAEALQRTQPSPIPSTITNTESEWDRTILSYFRKALQPVKISSAATNLVRLAGIEGRNAKREAWKDCARRIGDFLRAKVLCRVGRYQARVNEKFRASAFVQPFRWIVK